MRLEDGRKEMNTTLKERLSFGTAVSGALGDLEGGECILSTSTDSNDSTDSKDTFRYSQPGPN